MPSLTPETPKDIREIYNQVPKGVRLMSEAVPHLLAILELTASDESEGIKSHRVAIDVGRISNTLTERGYGNFEQTGKYDPKSTEIARHILRLMRERPYLWYSKRASEEEISDEELAEAFIEQSCDRHLFDDHPGLYGITDLQGQQLRSSILSFYDDSRLTVEDVENLIKEVRQELAAENNPE